MLFICSEIEEMVNQQGKQVTESAALLLSVEATVLAGHM